MSNESNLDRMPNRWIFRHINNLVITPLLELTNQMPFDGCATAIGADPGRRLSGSRRCSPAFAVRMATTASEHGPEDIERNDGFDDYRSIVVAANNGARSTPWHS